MAVQTTVVAEAEANRFPQGAGGLILFAKAQQASPQITQGWIAELLLEEA